MAAIMSAMQASTAVTARWKAVSPAVQGRSGSSLGGSKVGIKLPRRSLGLIRCEAKEGLQEAVDRNTNVEISRENILRNQEENQSETQSVFGSVPSSGGF